MKIFSNNILYSEKPEEYCNLEPTECKELNTVLRDSRGYTCCCCGKRVSKWIPVANVIGHLVNRKSKETPKLEKKNEAVSS